MSTNQTKFKPAHSLPTNPHPKISTNSMQANIVIPYISVRTEQDISNNSKELNQAIYDLETLRWLKLQHMIALPNSWLANRFANTDLF